MTVREVEEMPAAEYQGWMAYFEEYPPFEPWEAFGMLCSLVIAPYAKKRPRALDYMPDAYRRRARRRRPRQSAAEIMAAMGVVAARANAKGKAPPPTPCPPSPSTRSR